MARSRFAQIGKYLLGGRSSAKAQFLMGREKFTREKVRVQVPPVDLTYEMGVLARARWALSACWKVAVMKSGM